MSRLRASISCGCFLATLAVCGTAAPCLASPSSPAVTAVATPDRRSEVDAFNRALIDDSERMDDAALVALWEDDGVSLLPGTPPVVGKPAIARFIRAMTSELPNAHRVSFDMTCAGLDLAGDTASEYCDEHQVVDLGGGKPPDGRGHLLFVLHRREDGTWALGREMWNQGSPER